jgi:hypothetical protein
MDRSGIRDNRKSGLNTTGESESKYNRKGGLNTTGISGSKCSGQKWGLSTTGRGGT